MPVKTVPPGPAVAVTIPAGDVQTDVKLREQTESARASVAKPSETNSASGAIAAPPSKRVREITKFMDGPLITNNFNKARL